MTSRTLRLKHLAALSVSSVDKKSYSDEVPVRLVNYTDVYHGDRITPELDLMRATASPSEIKAFGLVSGDVVITKDSETADDIGIAAYIERSDPDMVCGYHLAICRPSSTYVDSKFLFWALSSDDIRGQFSSSATGVTRYGLRIDILGDVRIVVPPLPEQRAIADFLDDETAHIDTLIDKKQRLLELVSERRHLVGEEALKDLRASAPSVRLKYLISESDERWGRRSEPALLSVSIHHGVVPRESMAKSDSSSGEYSSYKLCHPGDIAINRMRAFQGGVGIVGQRGVVSPDYTVVKVGGEVSADYLHFLMRSHWFISEMTRRLRGIGSTDQGNVRTPRINFADLGQIRIPVPEFEVQKSVSRRLAEQDACLAKAVRVLERQLGLLVERRQALITAALTRELEIPRPKHEFC